jgi:hypothetical protein
MGERIVRRRDGVNTYGGQYWYRAKSGAKGGTGEVAAKVIVRDFGGGAENGGVNR